MDVDGFDEIVRRRRTVKPPMMSDEPIAEDELRALFELANWAPSHGLTEPWRFRVYRGEARAKLAEALGDLYERAVPEARKKPGKADKLRKMPLLAPVVVVVWMKRQEAGKISELDETLAVACAVQNLTLGATARGLGSFWSTPPFIGTPEMKAWLGIGPEDRCLGLLYLGRPAEPDALPSGRRGAADDKVEWIDG